MKYGQYRLDQYYNKSKTHTLAENIYLVEFTVFTSTMHNLRFFRIVALIVERERETFALKTKICPIQKQRHPA